MTSLVSQWALIGLSNKSMEEGLFPQTRDDSKAAASLNSSLKYDEDLQKLQTWSSLHSFSGSLTISLQVFLLQFHPKHLFTHFYAARDGLSSIFQVLPRFENFC